MSSPPDMAIDCLFCKLVNREGEASIVHEDERTVTLMDIQPVTAGHMLVIPRTHATHLADLDSEDGTQMFRVAQAAAASLRSSALACEGVNFFLADGEAAGQEVFHVHLHVIPRFAGDGIGFRLPEGHGQAVPRSELDRAAAAIRSALKA